MCVACARSKTVFANFAASSTLLALSERDVAGVTGNRTRLTKRRNPRVDARARACVRTSFARDVLWLDNSRRGDASLSVLYLPDTASEHANRIPVGGPVGLMFQCVAAGAWWYAKWLFADIFLKPCDGPGPSTPYLPWRISPAAM